MFTVFTTADELTQSFAVFKTYPNTTNQNLFRLSLYILMSRKNRSSAIKVNNIMQLFYISSVRVTWFYKEKVAEIRHVIFCNICLNEEIVPWAPSFSICNCFTCLWQFQQLLAKKKEHHWNAVLSLLVAMRQLKTRRSSKKNWAAFLDNIRFANHCLKIIDSSDFLKL